MLLLFGLCSEAKAASDILFRAPLLYNEVERLEDARSKGALTSPQEKLLAELYFMTSRCDEVKKLVAWHKKSRKKDLFPASDISCACGGSSCFSNTLQAKLSRFRTDLEGAPYWSARKHKPLWKDLSHLPEAQYLALKKMLLDPSPSVAKLRAEIEKSLSSLEVSQ